ncbi:alcohol-forming fatty acyl-CoA reductase [Sarracenia purpurea var. burkii]
MDRFLITQNISIVFYCAANVEFTNDLKNEIIANVFGATEFIRLLRYVRNLKNKPFKKKAKDYLLQYLDHLRVSFLIELCFLDTNQVVLYLYSNTVISTWKEPVKGWTDKAFAPTAMMKSMILGQMSSILCTDDVIVDMVPGDYVVNALIAVAWDVHNR